jgi:ribonucleoside-diphosphate reductase alpha chain
LSVLPFDNGTYRNAPFETCNREVYEEYMTYLEANPIDLTLIIEEDDNTEQAENLACAGGACELTF